MMTLSKTDSAFWEQKEKFIHDFTNLVEAFKVYLENENQPVGTVNGHYRVATNFVKHIKDFTDHLSIQEISVANANKKFLLHMKWEGLSDWQPKEIKIKLKRFFEFLKEMGFENEAVLLSL